jgi:hypothetical protein
MTFTVKAILARFKGNVPQAVAYCNGIADTATNPALRREYNELGQLIWKLALDKRMAAAV